MERSLFWVLVSSPEPSPQFEKSDRTPGTCSSNFKQSCLEQFNPPQKEYSLPLNQFPIDTLTGWSD